MKNRILSLVAVVAAGINMVAAQVNPLVEHDRRIMETLASNFASIKQQSEPERSANAEAIYNAYEFYLKKAVAVRLENEAKESLASFRDINDDLCKFLMDNGFTGSKSVRLVECALLRKAIDDGAISFTEERVMTNNKFTRGLFERRDSILATNPLPGSEKWEEASDLHFSIFNDAIRDVKSEGNKIEFSEIGVISVDDQYVGISVANVYVLGLYLGSSGRAALQFISYKHPVDGERFFAFLIDAKHHATPIASFSRSEIDAALKSPNRDEKIDALIWKPLLAAAPYVTKVYYSTDGSLQPEEITTSTGHPFTEVETPSIAIAVQGMRRQLDPNEMM